MHAEINSATKKIVFFPKSPGTLCILSLQHAVGPLHEPDVTLDPLGVWELLGRGGRVTIEAARTLGMKL